MEEGCVHVCSKCYEIASLDEGSEVGWREGGANSFSDGVQGRLLRGGDI